MPLSINDPLRTDKDVNRKGCPSLEHVTFVMFLAHAMILIITQEKTDRNGKNVGKEGKRHAEGTKMS